MSHPEPFAEFVVVEPRGIRVRGEDAHADEGRALNGSHRLARNKVLAQSPRAWAAPRPEGRGRVKVWRCFVVGHAPGNSRPLRLAEPAVLKTARTLTASLA